MMFLNIACNMLGITFSITTYVIIYSLLCIIFYVMFCIIAHIMIGSLLYDVLHIMGHGFYLPARASPQGYPHHKGMDNAYGLVLHPG